MSRESFIILGLIGAVVMVVGLATGQDDVRVGGATLLIVASISTMVADAKGREK